MQFTLHTTQVDQLYWQPATFTK